MAAMITFPPPSACERLHPATGRRAGFEIGNTPMVNDPRRSTVVQLSRSALAGQPYTVSEVNHPFPNAYACEGIPILAAYAALHDWDGVFWYTLGHEQLVGEPARAITRNVIVIAVGFTPLLFAPLVPYITVGVFLASILFVSGVGTLFILPALVRVAEPLLFPKTRVCSMTCRCGTCIVTGVTAVALVAVNVGQFLSIGWTKLTLVSLILLPILAGTCALMSRREKCRLAAQQQQCDKE